MGILQIDGSSAKGHMGTNEVRHRLDLLAVSDSGGTPWPHMDSIAGSSDNWGYEYDCDGVTGKFFQLSDIVNR